MRAVCATKLPTLTFQDVGRFRGLLGDIFPGTALSDSSNPELDAALHQAAEDIGLKLTPQQVCCLQGLGPKSQPWSTDLQTGAVGWFSLLPETLYTDWIVLSGTLDWHDSSVYHSQTVCVSFFVSRQMDQVMSFLGHATSVSESYADHVVLHHMQVERMLQLHLACEQRIGVIIVGPSGSGKSTLWQVRLD